ncbi:MAG: hypothetical protein WD469_02470 [Paenibacillaceae bacterium]
MELDKEILDKLARIRIAKVPYQVAIENPTHFQLLGQGKQGAVFQIDEERCVKIYFNNSSLKKELHALQLGGKLDICPKLYLWGDRFIVMEYLDAPSLFDYLQQQPITKPLTRRIIHLLDCFEQVGFNRFDQSARHIYLLPSGQIKVIDLVHIIKNSPVWLAEKLIKDMGDQRKQFIDYVQEISPKWYERWVNHDDFSSLMKTAKDRV